MKHLVKFFVMGAALVSGMMVALAVQNATTVNSATNTSGYYAPQKLDASGNLYVNIGAASAPVTVAVSSSSTLPVSLVGASAVSATIVGSSTLPVNIISASGTLSVSEAGALSTLNVTTPTVIKAGAGRLVSVNVISASGVGAIYDSLTVASGVTATQIAAIPATVGNYQFTWPFFSGLVINPASSNISVNYQ